MPDIYLTGDQTKLLLSIANRRRRPIAEIRPEQFLAASQLWEMKLVAGTPDRALVITDAGRTALEAI